MSLRILTPASHVVERLVEDISSGNRIASLVEEPSGGAAPDSVGLAAPHPVFNLGLDAIDLPDWLSNVQMTGWRYFVTMNDRVVAATEASTSEPNGAVRGTWTNQGPFVAGAEEALALSERRAVVAKGKFVLGMLRVPALHIVALWLRDEDGNDRHDRFVPVAPVPKFFKANSPMTPSNFIVALRHLKDASRHFGEGDDRSN